MAGCTFESHVHHPKAKQWFEGVAADGCAFCRMTQQGFLRLATNPKAFGAETVTMAEAWDMYDTFLMDPRVSYSEEPTELDELWRGYTARESFTPKL